MVQVCKLLFSHNLKRENLLKLGEVLQWIKTWSMNIFFFRIMSHAPQPGSPSISQWHCLWLLVPALPETGRVLVWGRVVSLVAELSQLGKYQGRRKSRRALSQSSSLFQLRMQPTKMLVLVWRAVRETPLLAWVPISVQASTVKVCFDNLCCIQP